MHHARGSNEGARAHTQEILCCQSPSPAVFALPRAPMASPTLPLITRRACTRSRARILGSRCICRGHACSSLNIILVGGAVALRPRSVGVGVKEVCRFRNQRLGNITDQRQILHQPPQGAGRDATPFPLAGAQQCGPKVDRQDLHTKKNKTRTIQAPPRRVRFSCFLRLASAGIMPSSRAGVLSHKQTGRKSASVSTSGIRLNPPQG